MFAQAVAFVLTAQKADTEHRHVIAPVLGESSGGRQGRRAHGDRGKGLFDHREVPLDVDVTTGGTRRSHAMTTPVAEVARWTM
jgi:hypothetical protein